jgi:hypothetical protein
MFWSEHFPATFDVPKWAMSKRILAKILADQFAMDCGWGDFMHQILLADSRHKRYAFCSYCDPDE